MSNQKANNGKKMIVTLGVNVCAYATITVEGFELGALPAIAPQVLESGHWNGAEVLFEPEWGTESELRIVSVQDEADNFLAENISCEEPVPKPAMTHDDREP